MANTKKKSEPGEERFIATGKSVTLLSTPKKAQKAKKASKRKGVK